MTTQGIVLRTDSGQLQRIQLAAEESAQLDTHEDSRSIRVIDGSVWVTFIDTMTDVVVNRGERLMIGRGRGATVLAVGAPASFFLTGEK